MIKIIAKNKHEMLKFLLFCKIDKLIFKMKNKKPEKKNILKIQ